MDILHAPWRIDYILAPKEPLPEGGESIFTRMARANDDVAHLIIHRGKSCFAVMNRYPYNGGHVMTVPYKQVRDLNGLNADEITELMLLTRRCQNAIQAAMNPDGFNVGINLGRVAGAGIVEHLHIHIVPRWNGDTNFMPVLGQTSVVPEALEETAEKLRVQLVEQSEIDDN